MLKFDGTQEVVIINKIKFYLDKVCKNNHEYIRENGEKTGKSLRYISSSECVICSRIKKRHKEFDGTQEVVIINGTKFFKGRLCKKEDHEYENSGKSLRYISTGACSECNKSFNEEFKINNPYYNINWYNSNRESHLKQCKEFYDNKQRKYCEENNINYEEFKNGNKSKGELIVCAFLMENNINFEYGKLFF